MHDSGDDHSHAHEPAAAGHHHGSAERWKHDGVRVIPGDRLDSNTAQTPGMFRQANEILRKASAYFAMAEFDRRFRS